MMIVIEELEVPCFIGVYEEEHKKKQILTLSLWLHYECKKAIKSDALADTLDYDQVILLCKEVAARGPYKLIERFAATLLEAIYAHFSPLGVKVKITKKLPEAKASIVMQKGKV